MKKALASWLLLAFAPVAAAAGIALAPQAPRAGDTVWLQFQPASGDFALVDTAGVTMAANRITVRVRVLECPLALCPPVPAVKWPLGQFPAGTYEVEVLTGATEVGRSTFTVTAKDLAQPQQNFSDLWWNAAESGWGLNITQHESGVIFATWFAYGPDGKPIWYVVPEGTWSSANPGRPVSIYTGPIYRTTGPEVGDSFDPRAVTRTLVGQATFAFAVPDDGLRATFVIDGRTVVKTLSRQGF
jgi:hypothetical protein